MNNHVFLLLSMVIVFAPCKAQGGAINLDLPAVTDEEIRAENDYIRAEGLKAWKAKYMAQIEAHGEIKDLYFELLTAATRINKVMANMLYHKPNYPEHPKRFFVGFEYIGWGFSQRQDNGKLQEEIHVIRIIKGSPAHQAGLKAWDRIISVNGKRDWKDKRDFQDLLRLATLKETHKKHKGRMVLDVIRSDSTVTLDIDMVELLNYPFVYFKNPTLAAFAYKKNVYISTGMVEFCENKNELSFVLAHEISHLFLRHLEEVKWKTVLSAMAGLGLDLMVATTVGVDTQLGFARLLTEVSALSYSKQYEREADYLALYLVTSSGGDVSTILNFWRRRGIRELANTGDLLHSKTHPSDPERSIFMLSTFKEIQSKLKEQPKVLLPTFER